MDKSKSSIKTGVVEPVVGLTIFSEIPSGPEALLVSKAFNKLKTSSSVHTIAPEGEE